MGKILLFDDRPQVRNSLTEKFESKGFEVIPCRTIYEANDAWNDKMDEINAIVVDMMIPSSGIDKKLRHLTKGGLLSGWIWLWNVLHQEEGPHPAADKCIVIYSAYLDDFDDYIAKLPDGNEKEFASRVKRIAKGSGDQEDQVVEYVINYLKPESTS